MIYSLPSITHVNGVTVQTTDGSGNAIPSYFSMTGDAVNGLLFTMTPTSVSPVGVTTIKVIFDNSVSPP